MSVILCFRYKCELTVGLAGRGGHKLLMEIEKVKGNHF